ncbi:MAG: pimeloyl-ACP methyl ester carboxylesterase [Flavobacteriaceae bacterium]|jgi:pimeloyl-ACP methyl ester carboxylesterase
MERISIRNERYTGANNRESLYDLTIPENWNDKVIVFIHGYMGYKDWGCWNLVESYFTNAGFGFIKYNVSHNGGTATNPIDFDDLDAFSKNTYSNEIADFEAIVEVLSEKLTSPPEILLIGHSRGGGIALLQAEHPSVQKIATLASISSIASRFPTGEALATWKKDSIRYRKNGRTKQNMPTHIGLYDDYISNQDRLNIERYCRESTIPTCIIHGADDTSVIILEGETIAKWLNQELIVLDAQQHTFGSSQPWEEKELALGLKDACKVILHFFET